MSSSSSSSSSPTPPGSDTDKETKEKKDGSSEENAQHQQQLDVCPQCGAKFSRMEDITVLNPSPSEEERMRAAMDRRRLLEPTKKPKKRKIANGDGNGNGNGNGTGASADLEEPPPSKKSKSTGNSKSKSKSGAEQAVLPSTNPSVAAASRAVVSSLAMEEAKRKAGMSAAVKSLYSSEDRPAKKETFMTFGTFTRVSFFVDLN
jgi:hypothetical protein